MSEKILLLPALLFVFYRRNLPHWHPTGKALFITWRLHATIQDQHYLARPEIAQLVINALKYTEAQLRHYDLEAWVVMSNHVHISVHPLITLAVFMKALKNFTARQANTLLRRTGAPFWQHEYFDHWIRGMTEFYKTVAYIEANPVRAELVRKPEQYLWSSASGREAGPTD